MGMLSRYACVRQTDQSDSGAVAPATVPLHHRRPVGQHQLRDLAGTNLLALLRAAEQLDLSAKGVKRPYEALSRADCCDRWTVGLLVGLGQPPPRRGAINQSGEADADASCVHSAPTVRCGPPPFPQGSSTARAVTGKTAIAGYEVLGEAGRGGQGVVYKARQLSRGRLAALKVMQADAGLEQLARFCTEAEALGCLRHPYIVQVYEVSDRDGCLFFSMEFIEGGSLEEKIAGKPQPARWAARLVEAVARAVHCAHQHGLVHCDLKPANVLLTAEGAPKVIDFGLARRLGGAATPVLSDAVCGTPSYMAPEQAEGKAKEIGPATDVYGLGGILYELLTGRPPFEGKTIAATLWRVRFQEPAPPSRLGAGVSPAIEAICLKCLRKVPSNRYASAGAMAKDLRRFLDSAVLNDSALGMMGPSYRAEGATIREGNGIALT
jgi:serine/threonine protein kinase